jgi:hypothetical protein
MKSDTELSEVSYVLGYVEAMWAAKCSRVSKNRLKMNHEQFRDFITKSNEFWQMLRYRSQSFILGLLYLQSQK